MVFAQVRAHATLGTNYLVLESDGFCTDNDACWDRGTTNHLMLEWDGFGTGKRRMVYTIGVRSTIGFRTFS